MGDNLGGFVLCDNITELDINCKIINSGNFIGNNSIKKLTIGPKVEEFVIGQYLNGLEELIYDSNATGKIFRVKAMVDSSNLVTDCTLVIGPNVTAIPNEFCVSTTYKAYNYEVNSSNYCKFTKIDMSDATALTSVGSYSFAYLPKLTEVIWPIDESNSISIGANAFEGCCNYINITIPNNIVSIGSKAYTLQNFASKSDTYAASGTIVYGEDIAGKVLTTINSTNDLVSNYDWSGSYRAVFRKVEYELNGGIRFFDVNYTNPATSRFYIVNNAGSTENCERYFLMGKVRTVAYNNMNIGGYTTNVYESSDSWTGYTDALVKKSGYKFTGWYTDNECTNAYDLTSTLKDNIKLYAGWEIIQYEVTFNSNGESAVDSQGITENTVVEEKTAAIQKENQSKKSSKTTKKR